MLKLYNTLSRKKEIFRPKKGKRVNFFVCGPTVYDLSHIGHARTYIIFDVIAKYLRKKGYHIFYLQNITDIDDKIIKRAKEKMTTPRKLARDFEKEYLKDMKELKIDSVTKYARATEHIEEIINQVKRLTKKNYAYRIGDGIYYDIRKFPDYGKLSRRTVLQAEDGVSRIDESKGKRNKGDFCLWKFSKFNEPSWKSPWGLGRPGWHIEDTAITEKYFGHQYDIHGGGRDLIFPHHEAEIAQMEALSGKKPFVKYWLHSGFLTVGGQKMAKSLGNFVTIRDFINKKSPRILRFLIVKNHYRALIDYNEKIVEQTGRELARIDEFVDKLQSINFELETRYKFLITNYHKRFEGAMEDDFNTPSAIALLFELINKANYLLSKKQLGKKEAKQILDFLRKIDEIFNVIFWSERKIKIPKEIFGLVQEREKYRKLRQWKKADELRKKIKKMGYQVEDTKERPKIKKL